MEVTAPRELTTRQPDAQRAEPSGALVQTMMLNVERLAIAAPLCFLTIAAWAYRWTFDDGFIYFRTVDQVLAGNGPVFNAGERVESFTSPAWLAILVLGDLTSPLRLEYTAVLLSIVATISGLILGAVASARIAGLVPSGSQRQIRLPIGLMVFVSLWPVWVWSTSGMEVGLTYAWLGASFLILTVWAVPRPVPLGRRHTRCPGRLQLVILGLGPLIRPELTISSLAFVGLVAVMTPATVGGRIRRFSVAFAVPLVYQVFRMGYYGILVSTTAIAKEGTTLRAGRGWSYLLDLCLPYLLLVPLLGIVVFAGIPMVRQLAVARQTRVVATIAVVCLSGVSHAVYIVLIGGDYVHARLLLPALFAILQPSFVVAVSRRSSRAMAIVLLWAPTAILVLRPDSGDDQRAFTPGYHGRSLTYEDRGFDRRGVQPWMSEPGLYLAFAFNEGGVLTEVPLTDPDETVVASPAIGVNGYVLGPEIRVVDLYGLADPLIGHQRPMEGRMPGHEKPGYEPWIVARLAADPRLVQPSDLELLHLNVDSPLPQVELEATAWAQAVLRCEPVERLLTSVSAPLTVSRFISNLWNSSRNTVLRVDRDPHRAYVELCSADDLPEEVTELHARYTEMDSLPRVSDGGEVAALDDCQYVLVGTGELAQPWEPVHVSGHHLTVLIDPHVPATSADLFTLGPYGSDLATIRVQTDGRGRYRIRQDVNWFPSRVQPWSAIPSSGQVRLTLGVNFDGSAWSTTVGFDEVSALPLLTEGRSRIFVATPTFPSIAESSPIRVQHQALPGSALCPDGIR